MSTLETFGGKRALLLVMKVQEMNLFHASSTPVLRLRSFTSANNSASKKPENFAKPNPWGFVAYDLGLKLAAEASSQAFCLFYSSNTLQPIRWKKVENFKIEHFGVTC